MVYLDYAAATPVHPQVQKSMEPYFSKQYGNPSSIHAAGRTARTALENARSIVAKAVGVTPKEVIFTSGGTEANNWALFGMVNSLHKNQKPHIISTLIEHDSVYEPLKQLEQRGVRVTYLQPTKDGLITPQSLAKAITPQTILASIIYANNEIGTIQDLPALSKVLKKNNIPFHTDACQAPNYLNINMKDLGVDLMTLGSNKIYGPKGAGALIIKHHLTIAPLLFGGGQEFRMRSGTPNVPAIVGFEKAIQLLEPQKSNTKTTTLRNHFIQKLLALPGISLNGHPTKRLANNINITIDNISAESLLIRLDLENIAASAGSACSSGSLEPSRVLQALGLTKNQANSSIRFSLGNPTTKQELTRTLRTLTNIIKDLRRQSTHV